VRLALHPSRSLVQASLGSSVQKRSVIYPMMAAINETTTIDNFQP
jgi:hypothetical protein